MIKISPENKKLVNDLLSRKGGKPLDEKIAYLRERNTDEEIQRGFIEPLITIARHLKEEETL